MDFCGEEEITLVTAPEVSDSKDIGGTVESGFESTAEGSALLTVVFGFTKKALSFICD